MYLSVNHFIGQRNVLMVAFSEFNITRMYFVINFWRPYSSLKFTAYMCNLTTSNYLLNYFECYLHIYFAALFDHFNTLKLAILVIARFRTVTSQKNFARGKLLQTFLVQRPTFITSLSRNIVVNIILISFDYS